MSGPLVEVHVGIHVVQALHHLAAEHLVAWSLCQHASFAHYDEPTASLDLGYQLDVAALLARLNCERTVTMVLATHDLNLAAALCHRLVVMRNGRVLAQGPCDEVLTAEMVQRLYDVDADVHFHERAGHLMVLPVRRLS